MFLESLTKNLLSQKSDVRIFFLGGRVDFQVAEKAMSCLEPFHHPTDIF